MQIKPLNVHTVRITLSKAELDNFNLSYAALINKTTSARLFLQSMAEILRDYKGADLKSRKSYLEIFADNEGGVTIYLSALPDRCKTRVKKSGDSDRVDILTIEETTPQGVISLLRRLSGNLIRQTNESRLYFRNNRYRLVIKAKAPVLRELEEICDNFQRGEFFAYQTEEHFKRLIKSNALFELAKKFSG